MSVIVRGMEMPKACGTCQFAVLKAEGYYCAAQPGKSGLYDYEQAETRAKECPLFELKDWRKA